MGTKATAKKTKSTGEVGGRNTYTDKEKDCIIETAEKRTQAGEQQSAVLADLNIASLSYHRWNLKCQVCSYTHYTKHSHFVGCPNCNVLFCYQCLTQNILVELGKVHCHDRYSIALSVRDLTALLLPRL